ncbi:MAG: serine/threonine protein kinase [Planctomycetes bacterium]|nr:serine/threonine protein kinase [Planctomycetota bacterium]
MSRGGTEYKKGDTVEGFKVLSDLGRGAASAIYLVKDKENHIWALKHVEKIEPKDQRFLDQAEAEYHVAQALDHPSIRKIVKMIKRGKSLLSLETTHLYLVMELVDGVSMEVKPPKTFEEAVLIFEQTAEALHHMHTRGFVHADMKPNNIVVTADDTAKIIDLGQSCRIDTVKERIQGTPDYIAPEQVHCRPITPKTDVYNLGASMYWILTRKHIPTALGKGDSLLGKIDDNLIEKPAPAIALNPRIPPMLSELIMNCLEIDPEKRPADMKLVSNRLNLIRAKLIAMRNGPAAETAESQEDSAA